MKELLRRIKFLFRRAQFERDLEEEIRYHLDRKAEDQGASGAVKQFGNAARIKEESRRAWIARLPEQLVRDVRYGIRALATNPLFTIMAILSLALGIGANTAIYSFLDSILLRDLPVRHPEELVVLNWRSAGKSDAVRHLNGSQYRDGDHGIASPDLPYPFFQLLQSGQRSLSALFAYAPAGGLNVVIHNNAEIAEGLFVSGSFFHDLGIVPAAGRLFMQEDDRAGGPALAVLSYNYWQKRFLSNPSVVSQSFLVNHVPVTILGVAAPGFFGVNPAAAPTIYLPLHSHGLFTPERDVDEQNRFVGRDYYWLEVMGRLRPGITLREAQSELAGRFRQYVESTTTSKHFPELFLQSGAGGVDSLRRRYSTSLYILMAMVALILVIACANIANLLLARAASRRREMAIRLSLGAGRARIVGQLLTESVLLSFAGAALGLLVAHWGIRFLTWMLAHGREEFTLHASLNGPVLAFTLALAVLTGILFGLAPALHATRVDLTSGLKETHTGQTRRRRLNLGHTLVAAQVALSLLLIVAAGLFIRTLSNLHSVELGFNREHLLIFTMNARRAGYKDAALARFYADLTSRFDRIPGVLSASLSRSPLAIGSWDSTDVLIPSAPKAAGRENQSCYEIVDPSFLKAMQIPLLAGRQFNQRDMESPRVAIVTEAFAKKFFPNENPLGRRFGWGEPADIEIVGVAKNTVYNSIKEKETPPVAYIPFTQDLKQLSEITFELRTAGDPLLAANAARQIVHQQDPSVPIDNVSTLSALIDQTFNTERTFAQLCTCFAVLALVIACVGLYGSIAYVVARRTSEIGIRMALGAERRRILWMVLGKVFSLAAIGLGIGLIAAWSTTRFVESFLYGLKHNDPVVLSFSVLIMAAAAAAAGFVPAWRASRIDPMDAVRHE